MPPPRSRRAAPKSGTSSSVTLAGCRVPPSPGSMPGSYSSGAAPGSRSRSGSRTRPPLLGAGLRFTLAGVLLLGLTAARRQSLRTDVRLAVILAAMPFALAYGLVYWGEQYIPSGLAAVLFGVLPLYTALLGSFLLPDQPLQRAPGRWGS